MGRHAKSDKKKRNVKYSDQFAITEENKKKKIVKREKKLEKNKEKRARKNGK